MSDQNNALIVGIARIIDHPSVYMGGPSRNSLRIAKMIVKEFGADLARADRAEIERLTKGRDEALALLADAYGAGTGGSVIEAHLAEAERDMRQRAADSCLGLMTAQSARKFILALPLKHADREGGV